VRRPRRYSPELAARLLGLMTEGRSLRQICEMDGMPTRRAVLYWLKDNEEFREKYEIARQMQVEWWAHEIIEIADDTSGDYVINDRGERVLDKENVHRTRLRIDTRKWLMSKLLPRKYGGDVGDAMPAGSSLLELATAAMALREKRQAAALTAPVVIDAEAQSIEAQQPAEPAPAQFDGEYRPSLGPVFRSGRT